MSDKWLDNLMKTDHPAPGRVLSPTVDPVLTASVFDFARDDSGVAIAEERLSPYNDPGDASGPDLVGDLIKTGRDAMLKSFVGDASWDEPMTKTAAPTLFIERSNARFEKACESFRKVFGDSTEYTEAVEIARRVVNEERVAALLGRELPRADGTLLSKSAISSEMLSTLSAFRKYCTREEVELLEKAAKALDLPAFFEISRGVIARQAA